MADEAGGRLRIMGTPAEEGGGGKIDDGSQRAPSTDSTAAMMVHPADADLIAMDTIAVQELYVELRTARPRTPPPHRRRAATRSMPPCSAT